VKLYLADSSHETLHAGVDIEITDRSVSFAVTVEYEERAVGSPS
jgi:hypothetical protein